MQNAKVQVIRPPVPVRRAPPGSGSASSAHYWALAVFGHEVAFFRRLNVATVLLRMILFRSPAIQIRNELWMPYSETLPPEPPIFADPGCPYAYQPHPLGWRRHPPA